MRALRPSSAPGSAPTSAARSPTRVSGVLTKGEREMQQAKLQATGLALADVLLIPTVDLGCPKPQRAAYLAACDQLGAAPADTLMVGDSLTNDVQGARKAGLYALHLDRAGDGDLSSLSALKEVLPQIAS